MSLKGSGGAAQRWVKAHTLGRFKYIIGAETEPKWYPFRRPHRLECSRMPSLPGVSHPTEKENETSGTVSNRK